MSMLASGVYENSLRDSMLKLGEIARRTALRTTRIISRPGL